MSKVSTVYNAIKNMHDDDPTWWARYAQGIGWYCMDCDESPVSSAEPESIHHASRCNIAAIIQALGPRPKISLHKCLCCGYEGKTRERHTMESTGMCTVSEKDDQWVSRRVDL